MNRIAVLTVLSILLWPGSALALVNINTASLEELDTLPGVGPATAEKIIDARPFSKASDIENVQGIGGPGTKTYDDIIGLITVSGSSSTTEDDDEEEEEDSSTDTKNETAKKVYTPVGGLIMEAPEVAYVNQTVNFKVEPKDGRKDRLVRYEWSFGDGHSISGSQVTHSYKHPGKYVVVVEGYYLKEFFTARAEVLVLSASLSLTEKGNGDVTITNTGDEEVDLSGMSLRGRDDFFFPKHTILLSGSSLTVNVPGVGGMAIFDQAGLAVAAPAEKKMAAALSTMRTASAATPKEKPAEQSLAEEIVAEFGPEQALAASNAAAASTASKSEHWPYLGLLGLVLLGMYGLWNKKSVSSDS